MSVPRGYQSIPLKVNRLQTVISSLTEIFKLIRQTIFTKEIITVPAKKLNSDSETLHYKPQKMKLTLFGNWQLV